MRKDENQISSTYASDAAGIDLRALLRPTEYFSSPDEVLENQMLDVSEKRAILASWASDLYAIESVPALRQLPGSHAIIAVRDILAALRKLDGPETEQERGQGWLPLKLGKNRVDIGGKALFTRAGGKTRKISSEPLELRN
jgi:hypothetical protein